MDDPETLTLPPPRRRRRTQAERTAETRTRIIAATVEGINEVGFQRTTTAEISRRSGLTWGAIQHHFGSKDGILAAVLEDSFNRFAAGLAEAFEPLGPETSLRERIDAFVDAAWSHFESIHYRATFEILLEEATARRVDPERAGDLSWQEEMLLALTRTWQQLFPDVRLGRWGTMMILHYTISTLAGLASSNMLSDRENPFVKRELALLKSTLADEFESSGTDRRGGSRGPHARRRAPTPRTRS